MAPTRGKRDRGPFGMMAGLYLEKGWSPLPVEPHSKRIAVDGFTGHDGTYPTRAQVVSWGTDGYAFHNVGLRLPVNVIGIDVDAYGDRDGARTLDMLEHELGELPATYVSTARKDGMSGIRLFRVKAGQRNWRGKAGPGIDVISWHYRYVVCAPSIHPSTASEYKWYQEDDESRGLIPAVSVPPIKELPYLSDIWQEFLSSDYEGVKSEKLTPEVITDWISVIGRGEQCEVLRATCDAWTERVSSATDDGGIHDEAKDGIHAIIGDAMVGHAGASAALSRLRTVFMQCRKSRHDSRSAEATAEWRRLVYGEVRLRRGTESMCDDPCTDEYASAESLKSIRPVTVSGKSYDKDEAEIRRRVKDMRLSQAARWQLQTEDAAERPAGISGAKFLELDIPAPRVLIESLLPLDGNALLVAQRKAGKTTLVHNLIKAMCDDADFLGAYPVQLPEGMRFGLFDFEMQQGMLLEWLRATKVSKRGAAALEVFSFRGKASSFNVMSPRSRGVWAEVLQEAKIGYMILDCLAPAMAANGLDENDNSAVAAFLNAIDEINQTAGISGMLAVHHMGHSGERGRGASRLRDWPETEIHLIVDGQGQDDNGHLRPRATRFLAGEGRLGAFDEVGLSFSEEKRQLFVAQGSRMEAAVASCQQGMMNHIQQNSGCSKTSLFGVLDEQRNVKEAAIRELLDDGSVCNHPGARGAAAYYDNRICPDESAHAMKIRTS
jgi:hypothetical protein